MVCRVDAKCPTSQISASFLVTSFSLGLDFAHATSFNFMFDQITIYTGFEINACLSVRGRLKSPRANCFYFSLSRRTDTVLCCCYVAVLRKIDSSP